MNWIENFGSPTGVEDGAPVVWKNADTIMDQYIVSGVRETATGQICTVHHREWLTTMAVRSPLPDQFETAQQRADFIREIDVGLKLGLNPYIVTCHYVLWLGGLPRIFSEDFDAETLADWIRSGKLYADKDSDDWALSRIMRIAIRSAWGLHYAHLHGVVHQDVKPANIAAYDVYAIDMGYAKVANFGGAVADPPTPLSASQESKVQSVELEVERMTEAYSSPEQARGALVSYRTDIWSWAVTVLEMFIGEVTWSSGLLAGKALEEYLAAKPDDSKPRMPEEVAAILRKCFQDDPAQRPLSLLAIAGELESFFEKFFDESFERGFVASEPRSSAVLNNRALSYFNLGRTEEAIAVWDESLKLDRLYPETVFNRGLVLWRAGKIDDEQFLSQMKQVKDADWRAPFDRSMYGYSHYLLALSHFEQGNWNADLDMEYVEDLDCRERNERITALYDAFWKHDKPDWSSPVRGQHEYGIRAVCFAADGKWALTASNDRSLQLWDVSYSRWLTKGEPVRTFSDHSDEVRAVCVSKDGGYVASASRDKTVKLWELYTGGCLKTFAGHADAVTSVCFDSQGKHLFSSGSYADMSIRMWDTSTGETVRTFVGHTGPVNAISVSADDKYLASVGGFEDNTVKLWDVATGTCLSTLVGHTDIVQSVSISADGKFIVSGGSDRTVRLWDTTTGECVRTMRGHPDTVFSVAQTPDGRFAVSGSRDGRLKLWALSSGRCLRTFIQENHAISAVDITADGTFALSAANGGDNKLRFWRTNADFRWFSPLLPSVPPEAESAVEARQTFEDQLKATREAIDQKDFSRAIELINSAGDEGGYELHPDRLELLFALYPKCEKEGLEEVLLVNTFDGHALETETVGGAESVQVHGYYNPNVLSRGRMTLKLWYINTGDVRYEYKHWTYLTAADLSPDGEFMVYADSSCKVEMRRLRDGMCMRGFYNIKGYITSLSFNFYHNRLLTNGDGSIFKIWNSRIAEVLHECVGHTDTVTAVCLSRDVKLAVSGSEDHTVRLWDVESGKCLRIFNEHEAAISTVSFNEGGTKIISGSQDGELKLWDIATPQSWQGITAHKGIVTQARLTAGGRFAVSGSTDRTIKLWDLRNGSCMKTISDNTAGVTSVGFSANEDYLVAGNQDGTVKVWNLIWKLSC